MVVEGLKYAEVSQTGGPWWGRSLEGLAQEGKRSDLQEAEWLSSSGMAGASEVCSDLGTGVWTGHPVSTERWGSAGDKPRAQGGGWRA